MATSKPPPPSPGGGGGGSLRSAITGNSNREGTAKSIVADQISQTVQSTSNLLHLMQQSSPSNDQLMKLPKNLLEKTSTIKNTGQVLHQMPQVISSLDAHLQRGLQSVPHLQTVVQLLGNMKSAQLDTLSQAHLPQKETELGHQPDVAALTYLDDRDNPSATSVGIKFGFARDDIDMPPRRRPYPVGSVEVLERNRALKQQVEQLTTEIALLQANQHHQNPFHNNADTETKSDEDDGIPGRGRREQDAVDNRHWESGMQTETPDTTRKRVIDIGV